MKKTVVYIVALRLVGIFSIYLSIGGILIGLALSSQKIIGSEAYMFPILFVLSVGSIIFAVALLMLLEWARKALIWVYGLFILVDCYMYLLPLVYKMPALYQSFSYKTIFNTLFYFFVIFFLTRPGVKQVTMGEPGDGPFPSHRGK